MTGMVARSPRSGAGPFVGRRHELDVVAAMLADHDRAGVALIGGESGLGKTRLVQEIVASAPGPVTVVRGGAVPRVTPIPFELIRSALESANRATRDADRDDLSLVTLEAIDVAELPLADRVRAVAEELRTLNDGDTIFVFEDVHWADAESLEVIDRLVVAGPLQSSLLMTYRPNGIRPGDPASGFLRRVERRSQAVQLRLEPLRRDEVAEYLQGAGRVVETKMVDHVHSRTGGNPLLLSELVASTDNDEDLTVGLPWTLAEILRPEIEQLPPAERRVAQAVAVLGTDVGFDLLAAAVDDTEDELLAHLRSLVDLGILIESGPDRFGYRHDLVREAVAEGLFTREQRRIHAAVHDTLLASGSEDVVALVTHASGAGRIEAAADAARHAAHEALALGRSHQAMAFAEQALLVHVDDIELMRVAVVAGWLGGRERKALDHIDRWEELVGDSSEARAEVIHHRVRLLWDLGDVEGADLAAVELAAVIEEVPVGAAKAEAVANLAQHFMLTGLTSEAMETADRALLIAAEVGPAAAGAARQARAERASALASQHRDRREAVGELLLVASDAEAAGDFVVASRALHNAPLQPPILDPRAHIERMRRASQRAGLTCIATEEYRISLLAIASAEGDKEAYVPLLDAALEDLGDHAEVLVAAILHAIEDGDLDTARRLAERLPDPGGVRRDGSSMRSVRPSVKAPSSWPHTMAAMIALADGDARQARTWLRGEHPSCATLQMIERFLSAFVEHGLRDDVERLVSRSEFDLDSTLLSNPVALAVRAELTGRPREADDFYAEALASGLVRSVIDRCEIHLARARLATAAGEDDQPHLDAAARILADWPGRHRDLVAQLRGDAMSEVRQSVLTPREREVATLVARGLTNGGIADELFISTKTASVHVSNILAKLTMSSRSEIAAWVASGGMA